MAKGLATTTEAEWAGDGGLYDEGIITINDVEDYLSKDLDVPGTWAGEW